MTRKETLGAALLCSTLLTALAAPDPSSAATPPKEVGFLVAPVGTPSLRFAARPGQTVSGRVRVVNLAARGRTIRLTTADLVTADTGGASFPTQRPKATGTWLRLDRKRVVLAGKASTTVGFRAVVPASVRPGQHYAGIVAVDAAQAATARRVPKKGEGVEVHHLARLALPVRLTVPGKQSTRLAVTDMKFSVDASGSSLRVGLRNAGNQIIREADMNLHVSQGDRELLAVRNEIRDFITNSAISYPVAWRGTLRPGSYRVSGTIRPRGGPALAIDQTVDFTPKLAEKLEDKTGTPATPSDGQPIWLWAVLAAVLIAGAAITTAYFRLRRRLKLN